MLYHDSSSRVQMNRDSLVVWQGPKLTSNLLSALNRVHATENVFGLSTTCLSETGGTISSQGWIVNLVAWLSVRAAVSFLWKIANYISTPGGIGSIPRGFYNHVAVMTSPPAHSPPAHSSVYSFFC